MSIDDYVVFDVESWLAWFRRRGDGVSVDEWQTAAARVGRDLTPDLLHALFQHGLLNGAPLAYAVAHAWTMHDSPTTCLSPQVWRELYTVTGYMVDGAVSEPPEQDLRLFRGSAVHARRGWSWTSDPRLAHWFADRRAGGMVWEATVAPHQMLATYTAESDRFRRETEIVVDPTDLVIQPHLCRCTT